MNSESGKRTQVCRSLCCWARMHHKVVGNFTSEADVPSLYYSRFTFNETSDDGASTHGRPAKKILTEFRPRYFESEPDFRPMHTKLERLLSKSLTTLEVMTNYLVVHTGPGALTTRPTRRLYSENKGVIFVGITRVVCCDVCFAAFLCIVCQLLFLLSNRLVGLVVKASASGAYDPGFDSRLRRDFFGVESYQ